MKIQDARIGMKVKYHNTFGRIVQIGNASRETREECTQPYDLIYMQPDDCIVPGGLIGSGPENFQEVRSNPKPDMIVHLIPINGTKMCPYLRQPCIRECCEAYGSSPGSRPGCTLLDKTW